MYSCLVVIMISTAITFLSQAVIVFMLVCVCCLLLSIIQKHIYNIYLIDNQFYAFES